MKRCFLKGFNNWLIIKMWFPILLGFFHYPIPCAVSTLRADTLFLVIVKIPIANSTTSRMNHCVK